MSDHTSTLHPPINPRFSAGRIGELADTWIRVQDSTIAAESDDELDSYCRMADDLFGDIVKARATTLPELAAKIGVLAYHVLDFCDDNGPLGRLASSIHTDSMRMLIAAPEGQKVAPEPGALSRICSRIRRMASLVAGCYLLAGASLAALAAIR